MGDVVAVVVGIEKYALPGIEISGPYSNAIRVATHLTAMRGERTTVGLFVNHAASSPAREEELDRLRKNGVAICEDPTKSRIIDHFAAICRGATPGSRLFVYWCGHGFVRAAQRFLLCSDFNLEPYLDRNWNATNRFLSFGRRDVYSSFTQHLGYFSRMCAREQPPTSISMTSRLEESGSPSNWRYSRRKKESTPEEPFRGSPSIGLSAKIDGLKSTR